MKRFKRIISSILAVMMCFSLNMSVFAAKVTSDSPISIGTQIAIDHEEEIMPMGTGSISGYAYKRLTKSDPAIIVPLKASGFGGMGITVKTATSYNQNMYCQGTVVSSNPLVWVDGFKGDVKPNAETYFSGNHLGGNNLEFVIVLEIPEGVYVDVWVWVYG